MIEGMRTLQSGGRWVAQVRAEADKAFGPACDSEPPRRMVDDMTYTLSVLKETLRKYRCGRAAVGRGRGQCVAGGGAGPPAPGEGGLRG